MWGKENNVHLHSCKTTRFIEFHPSNYRLWHVPRAYIHSLHTLKENKTTNAVVHVCWAWASLSSLSQHLEMVKLSMDVEQFDYESKSTGPFPRKSISNFLL